MKAATLPSGARSPRVVSLLPSATEIICALGAQDQLVGISHECDFPASIRDRPVLTRSRIDASGSSKAIDDVVRAVIRDAISLYAVDDQALAALRPDVIVTQDLCQVCAVSLDDVHAAVARLAHNNRVSIVSLRPVVLSDVLGDVERVAAGLGCPEQGVALRDNLSARINAIGARAAKTMARPRVVSLEWIDPLMLGGTWMPEIIALSGGVPVGVTTGGPAPTITSTSLRDLRPDVVVIKPCGFSLERALRERTIINRAVLDVVGNKARVYATDGNAFFNRPGPRLVESLEIMAACVQPDEFKDLAHKHADHIVRLTSSS